VRGRGRKVVKRCDKQSGRKHGGHLLAWLTFLPLCLTRQQLGPRYRKSPRWSMASDAAMNAGSWQMTRRTRPNSPESSRIVVVGWCRKSETRYSQRAVVPASSSRMSLGVTRKTPIRATSLSPRVTTARSAALEVSKPYRCRTYETPWWNFFHHNLLSRPTSTTSIG
jgi:hypothetical protein